MRARQLKPGLYKNEDLAECSIWARFIFPGLWTMADRSGRLEDRPKRIKAELLPFDDQPIDPILAELEKWGFIKRYEVAGIRYIWIPNFVKHQNPHKNEKPSDLPAHPDDAPSVQAQDLHGASTVQAPDLHCGTRASSPIPSSPIPSSPTSAPPVHGGDGVAPEPKAKGKPKLDRPTHGSRPQSYAAFKACYGLYPVHQAEEEAWCEWCRLEDAGTLAPQFEVREAIIRHRDEDIRWKSGHAPLFSRWLNGKRWLDEPVTATADAPEGPPPVKSHSEADLAAMGITGRTW